MYPDTPVSRIFTEKMIPHRVFIHPGSIKSLEQAAVERGQKPEQIVRSFVFRITEGEYVMVLMAGPGQISWPELRRYLGQSRLTMASEAEVLAVTGYPIGAVSPFGLPMPVRILVDESVLREAEVSIGSGVRGTALILKTQDLLNALKNYETGRFGSR